MYLAPNATPSQAPSVWCTYISRFLVLFPPEQVAIDYAQERTHKGTLKELNISKLETEHQPSLTAQIMGCCSITLIEARSGTRAVLNGYSAVAFLSCGRREDFLFGEKKCDTVQRLWGLPRTFGQRSTAGAMKSCFRSRVTLKNESEMLLMTNQAVPAWEGKARLRQDWCSSKENPTASCFCAVRLPVISRCRQRVDSTGTLSRGQN